jgi:hypothetical protein
MLSGTKIMSLSELLQAANQLSEADLEQFAHQVWLLRAKRSAPVLSASETELLLRINQGLPIDLRQEYRDLVAKRDAETITATEYERMLALSDRIEVLAAQRAAALAQLADLRQVPLMQLMDELEG